MKNKNLREIILELKIIKIILESNRRIMLRDQERKEVSLEWSCPRCGFIIRSLERRDNEKQ